VIRSFDIVNITPRERISHVHTLREPDLLHPWPYSL
jgi:hypothetical protein